MRAPFHRRFNLDGQLVVVEGEGDDLARVIDRLLGPWLTAAPAHEPGAGAFATPIHFALSRGRLAPPPVSPPRFRFPPLGVWFLEEDDARHGDAATGDLGWRCHDGQADLAVLPEAGRVTGVVAEDLTLEQLSGFAGLTLWVSLLECLRARGRYPLHAASLVSPAGESVMLAGTKGSGKSTLTLALFEAGWSVLTDDTLFVERDGAGGMRLTAYPKRFHVCRDLVERRPDLTPWVREPEAYEPQAKHWLDLAALAPRRLIRAAAAPTRIVFPEIIDAEDSRRVDLDERATLLGLLPHSAFVLVRPRLVAPHLDLLRALADGAAASRLLCGRDVLARPARYLELLDAPIDPSLTPSPSPPATHHAIAARP